MTAAAPRIAILLATYQGAAFLEAQLESLARQSVTGWRLIVSDDGSRDGTREVVARFAARNPGREVVLVEGPRRGATRNFLSLVARAAPGEAIAFCDQDDAWLPDRLSRGLAILDDLRPALHVTRTTICDAALRPLRAAPLYRRPPGFLNALVQACTPGNTMLVNPAGAALLKTAVPAAEAAGIVSHDWWAYQMISGAGGRVIRDPAQTVLYRQHPENVMGRNDTPRAMLARLRGLGGGAYGDWLHRNVAALRGAGDSLTPENRAHLAAFSAAITAPGPQAVLRLIRLGVYRQTAAGTAALLAAAAAGRLRGA